MAPSERRSTDTYYAPVVAGSGDGPIQLMMKLAQDDDVRLAALYFPATGGEAVIPPQLLAERSATRSIEGVLQGGSASNEEITHAIERTGLRFAEGWAILEEGPPPTLEDGLLLIACAVVLGLLALVILRGMHRARRRDARRLHAFAKRAAPAGRPWWTWNQWDAASGGGRGSAW
jgi:hypothetical protein